MVRNQDTADAHARGRDDAPVHRAMAIDRLPRPAFEPPAAYLVSAARVPPAVPGDVLERGRAVLVSCGAGGPVAG
jgi:hypothetical protein